MQSLNNVPPTVSRIISLFGWGLFCVVAVLQMKHFNGGFLTNYGADIVCPAVLYWCVRRGKYILASTIGYIPGPEVTAVSLCVLCFGWEWSQRYDFSGTLLAVTTGHYDPFDLVAYALSLAACVLADRVWQWRRAKRDRFLAVGR